VNRDQLSPGSYHILEPNEEEVRPKDIPERAIILVPGVGFTAQGHRIGQGAGYYDRALAHRSANQIWVGLGYTCQLCNELPLEEHDRELDAVLLGGEWVKPPSTH